MQRLQENARLYTEETRSSTQERRMDHPVQSYFCVKPWAKYRKVQQWHFVSDSVETETQSGNIRLFIRYIRLSVYMEAKHLMDVVALKDDWNKSPNLLKSPQHRIQDMI